MPQIPLPPGQTSGSMTRRATGIGESGVRANGDAFGENVARAEFEGIGRIADAQMTAYNQSAAGWNRIANQVVGAVADQYVKDQQLEGEAKLSEFALSIDKGLEGLEATGDGQFAKTAEKLFDDNAKKLLETSSSWKQTEVLKRGLVNLRGKTESHAFTREAAGLKQSRIDALDTIVKNAETTLFQTPARYAELRDSTLAAIQQSALTPKEKAKAIETADQRFARTAVEKHIIDGNVGAASALMKDPRTIQALGSVEALRVQSAVNTAIEKQAKEADANLHWANVIAGTERVDPQSTEDRKKFDESFKANKGQALLAAGDPNVVSNFVGVAKTYGIVPSTAISVLNAQSKNGTPQEQAFAYQAINRIEAVSPSVFDNSGANAGLRGDADDFRYWTETIGIKPEEAVERIAQTRTPEFKDKKNAREAVAKDLAKDRGILDLQDEFDDSMWSTPDVGGSEDRDTIVAGYKRAFIEHYTRSGDADAATNAAKKDMHRTYGVSRLSGDGTQMIMRNPPEMRLPEPANGAGWGAYKKQLVDEVHAYQKSISQPPVDPSQIYLRNVRATDEAIAAGGVAKGKVPPYGFYWKDANGYPQTIPGKVFVPDVAKAREDALGEVAQAHGEAVQAQTHKTATGAPVARAVGRAATAATEAHVVKNAREKAAAPKPDPIKEAADEAGASLMDLFGFGAKVAGAR